MKNNKNEMSMLDKTLSWLVYATAVVVTLPFYQSKPHAELFW